ncbi:MAG: Fe-S protein assembly chaperone HscA [Alphaproteobacteria bacterium]|jgi:molecular chaperone HscA|nr:Fe-S protein assembly chaperone HscA [Alphaproteobacteria bacterium]MBT5861224.1 Fe-S protein assembly chaperone HscA [Alphaproteobacteria bacterium]
MAPLQIHEPGKTPLPHAKDQVAVGIDLGTTNTLIAVAREGRPEVLRDQNGHALLPSVVAYTPEGILVGKPARHALLDDPHNVVASVKRLMGRGAEDIRAVAGSLPYDIDTPNDDTGDGMVRLKVGGRSLTPVEISAELLRGVAARAETSLGHKVDRAVITVPAHFDDAARAATKDAARLAEIEVLRLVNEPTAAALAYGLEKGAEGIYAVYDFGGGTFDISVLRLQMGVFQVLATGGDAQLGGDDIDHVIAEHFMQERIASLGASTLSAGEARMALMSARLAKECLTTEVTGNWNLDAGGEQSSHDLDRTTMDRLIGPLVERTIDHCRDVLADAEVSSADIKGVVLVGGSTRVPLVARRVAEFFGSIPLVDIDPDEVVALGAALQAEALTVGSDQLLLDVAPLSLGIETMGGLVEKVVRRNTPVPAAQYQEFTTYQDGQTALMIHVLQGERELVDQNRSLARFELTGIPPMVAGAARVRVTFMVDADGLLTVRAEEATTGVQQEVAVKPSYGLNDKTMAAMLRASLENAQGDMAARLLRESKVEAERIALAVDAALVTDGDLLSDDERTVIDGLLAAMRSAVAGEDRDAVEASAAAINQGTSAFAQKRMDRGIRGALTGVSVSHLAETVDSGAKT